MDPKQRPIANWMNDMMSKHRISARAWAEAAGVGKDTVSRAVREDYTMVTSTRTLTALAAAICEPQPGVRLVPDVECLEPIVRAIAQAATGKPKSIDEARVRKLAEGMHDLLTQLATEPDAQSDIRLAKALSATLIK